MIQNLLNVKNILMKIRKNEICVVFSTAAPRIVSREKKTNFYRVYYSEIDETKWLWGVEWLTTFLEYGA